jgi:polysaccharide export outer membrane protein
MSTRTIASIGLGLAAIALGVAGHPAAAAPASAASLASADTSANNLPPAPASAKSWPAAPASAHPLQPYVLSPDDVLDISVEDHDELKTTVTVLTDGTIAFPQVGNVHAAGLTVAALKRTLQKSLSDTINDPEVTIVVRQSRPRRVSVLGAVHTPGQYDIKPDTRLLDVIAESGGLAQDPALTQATLVQNEGKSSLPIDIPKLMSGTDPSQNLVLSSGDVLLIQARDASTLQVQVTGQVAKPGSYAVPPDGATILSLLPQAGGALPDAALSQAQVLHAGQVKSIDLRPMSTDLNSAVGSMRLLPGDVLQIPAITQKIAVLGEVRSPGTYVVPEGGTLSATSALVLAGGATNDADKKNASVLREGANGQAVSTPIDVDALLRGRSTAQNVALKPGDILYVPSKSQSNGFNPLSLVPLASLFTIFRR